MIELSIVCFLIASITSIQAKTEICIASIYSSKYEGKRTASGISLNDTYLTAAHKTLPFGRKVRVTNLSNELYVIVRITDRGPYVRGRCIDLTHAAAKAIGCNGLCKVKIED